MDPGDLNLPPIFDPILIYLADNLPPPLYAFALNFLSHCLALLSALANLLASLLSKNPLEWDAQTILPPLITLLAAYLALVSIYRTTTWMIRTSFWFMKWGIILGTLVAGMSWYMGVTQAQVGRSMNTGLVSYIGNIALDMMNGRNRNAAGGERVRRSSRSKYASRPKPWESFDRHRQWQYSEDQAETEETPDLETLVNNLLGAAGRVLGEDSWWTGMKNMMSGVDDEASRVDEDSGSRKRGKTSTKSRSR